jgi:anti-sigma-K factor RskA
MSTQLTYNQALDLLPLYVLGALEPDEMRAMEAYLQSNQELAAKLQEAEAAVAQLAHSAPPAPLPADGKARLLARVAAETAAKSPALPVAPPPQPAPARPPVVSAKPRSSTTRWGGFGRNALRVATAFAALLLIVFVTQLQFQLNQATSEIGQLRAEVARLRSEAEAEQRVLALLSNAEQRVQVPGTALAPDAQATFYRSGEEGVLVVNGLAQLPPDKSYQLWLVVDGTPTPVGLLENPQPGMPSVLVIAVEPALQNFAIVDVSIERAGGSDTITKETIVLRGVVEEPAPVQS